jgi:molybdenum-dependent DNA-binding transcriptional regulator ModE
MLLIHRSGAFNAPDHFRSGEGVSLVRHLHTFVLIEAVARVGSIRKAAEDMNITASALNRRIQRFESEFGGAIFERLTRGVRLNPAGELVAAEYDADADPARDLVARYADRPSPARPAQGARAFRRHIALRDAAHSRARGSP